MRLRRRFAAWTLGSLILATVVRGPARADEAKPSPRVAAVWAAALMETRVAFDRPLDPTSAKAAVGRLVVLDENTPTVDLSDLKPHDREPVAAHHGKLRIAAARLVDDGRTLVLTTDPHPRVATYSLGLLGIKGNGEPRPGETINLAYDLTGVSASWDDGRDDAQPLWSGWWPSLDLDLTGSATRGSSDHERGFALLARPGRLTLATLLRIKRKGTVRITANSPITALLAGEEMKAVEGPPGTHRLTLPQGGSGELIDLTLTIVTGAGGKSLSLRATYQGESKPDDQERVLPKAFQYVAWSPPLPAPAVPGPPLPDLSGGDRARGEAIFFGDLAKCASCHQIRGKGGKVGPDLSDLGQRDRALVYRDVVEPSALIHPDFVSYTIALKDGQVMAGIVRAEGADAIRVTNSDAKTTVVPRAEIEEMRPSATSIMPVGLAGAIGEAGLRDLMTFLMNPPAKP